MIVSKNICLALVAAVLAKPDICVDHFIKAIKDVHDSGYFKLVSHLVGLLFPFGLESWQKIQSLSELDEKGTSSIGDQYFCHIMAFYYRAMLSEYLSDEKLRTTHDFEESEQNSVTKDTGECSAANTIQPNNTILNTDDTFTSCNERTNSENAESSTSTTVQPESKLDSGLNRHHERENNNVSRKMKESSFRDLYRICLVCSTVLLSDIYAQFQKQDKDIKNYVPEEHAQDREDSGARTEVEISLSVCIQEKPCMLSLLCNIFVNLFGHTFSFPLDCILTYLLKNV